MLVAAATAALPALVADFVLADVIMVQLKAGRGEKALASLADADQNCKGL